MRVSSPDGTSYRIRRRWFPWRQRPRDVSDGSLDLAGLADDPVSAIILFVVALVLLPVIGVAAVAFGEFLLLLLLMPFWVLARSIFGTPWIIEVKAAGTGLVHQEAVAGWDASQRRIEELGREIAAGQVAGRV